jgi:hypothetical protein
MSLDDSLFEVLHAAALRKKTDVDGIVHAAGLERSNVEAGLARAIEAKLAIAARGSYLVLPAGDAALQAEYPQRFAACRADADFLAAYERFEIVNRELKELITSWQIRTVAGASIPNDHSDEQYDGRVLDRLSAIQERIEALLAALARRLPRLDRYAGRLGDALERAEAGENEWVSGVRCDSYHTVWFELHEDLLRILGRAREE